MTAPEPRIVPISGTARPSRRLRRQLHAMYGDRKAVNLQVAMDDLVTVDALAGLLKQGIEDVCRQPDGRVNYQDLSVFVLRRILEHQR